MHVRIISVGKKHEPSLAAVIEGYSNRVLRGTKLTWEFVAPSGMDEPMARRDESERILARLANQETVWLLDERGTQISSPQLAERLETLKNGSTQSLTIIIGGAYGVSEPLVERADFVWSLSRLVFPHQIVRLLLAEQLYRAAEIARGSGYHHS